jgi:hypothetical protein
MDDELSMLLKTVIPLAAAALVLLLLYSFLPLWLFITVVIVAAAVAAIPKTRNAVINALKPPADNASPAATPENSEKK